MRRFGFDKNMTGIARKIASDPLVKLGIKGLSVARKMVSSNSTGPKTSLEFAMK